MGCPGRRSVKSKKERVEEFKRRITAMVDEVELDGLVLFAALCPDDKEPGDTSIPTFKVANGEHGHVAALCGNAFADLVLDYEKAAGNRSADVRAVLADSLLTSMRHAFGKADERLALQSGSHDDEEEKYLGRIAGPRFIKKAGNS